MPRRRRERRLVLPRRNDVLARHQPTFWSFANYLLPLAILELYLRANDRSSSFTRFAMAAGLFVLTLAMGIGILVATKVMWLPRLS